MLRAMSGRGTSIRRATASAVIALLACATGAAASPAPAGTAALSPNTPGTGSHLLVDVSGKDGGFHAGVIPNALGIAFEKGFTLDTAAVPGKCTVGQARNEQCPADSRLGGGAIGVQFAGDHYTAHLEFFRTDPPNAGDQGGIILFFKETESGYSDAGAGSVRTIDEGNLGQVIRWDKLPLPQGLPPGAITIDHLQLDLGAGSAAAPAAIPGRSHPRRHRHRVRLRCAVYHGHGRRRHCVRYFHGRRNHLPPRATKSAVGSFIANPPSCPAGTWTVQLQVDSGDAHERREAAAPCASG
jgi:hypothetical protein